MADELVLAIGDRAPGAEPAARTGSSDCPIGPKFCSGVPFNAFGKGQLADVWLMSRGDGGGPKAPPVS